MRKFIIILLILLLVPIFADATDYYVRKGGNDSCNGTVDQDGSSGNCAKLTIQAGINVATSAGDSVTVHTGTYNENLTSAANGANNNEITIQAASGETVSIYRITINHTYNIVDGFRITASGSYNTAGVQLNGNYNQATDNTILGVCPGTGGAVCAGVGVAGSYNTVDGNTLDGQDNGVNTSFVWGMHVSGSNNEILNNLIKDTNSIERGFEVYGNANRFAGNEIRNVDWDVYVSHPDLFQIFGSDNSTNHIIENNYFHDFNGQMGNFSTTGGNKGGWIWRNNIFANINSAMFLHISGWYFYNNTFYRTAWEVNGTNLLIGSYGATATLRNNAFIDCGTSVNNGWYDSGGLGDYNYVSDSATGAPKNNFNESNGVNGGNPYITAYYNDCTNNACDFSISSGSSALIGEGETLTGFSDDYDGNSRSVPWDIGAYEFTSDETTGKFISITISEGF